jgi:hypothetical protein
MKPTLSTFNAITLVVGLSLLTPAAARAQHQASSRGGGGGASAPQGARGPSGPGAQSAAPSGGPAQSVSAVPAPTGGARPGDGGYAVGRAVPRTAAAYGAYPYHGSAYYRYPYYGAPYYRYPYAYPYAYRYPYAYPYYPYYPGGYASFGFGYGYGGFGFGVGIGFGAVGGYGYYPPYANPAYGYPPPYGYPVYAYPGVYAPTAGVASGLRIKVAPNDAIVSVDGYYAGQVDQFDSNSQPLRLDPGPHHIEIRKEGYEPLSFDVRIAPDHTTTYTGELRTYTAEIRR